MGPWYAWALDKYPWCTRVKRALLRIRIFDRVYRVRYSGMVIGDGSPLLSLGTWFFQDDNKKKIMTVEDTCPLPPHGHWLRHWLGKTTEIITWPNIINRSSELSQLWPVPKRTVIIVIIELFIFAKKKKKHPVKTVFETPTANQVYGGREVPNVISNYYYRWFFFFLVYDRSLIAYIIIARRSRARHANKKKKWVTIKIYYANL